MRIVVIVVALVAGLGAGCAKEICEEAYDKSMACVEKMKCTGLDPVQEQKCTAAKQAAARNDIETAYKLACDEAEAQKVIDCALDPTTCRCP
jgi:hypothetical protein